MFKKAIASIITFIMIFSLAGCGDTNIEMLRKLNEASKWKAVNNKEEIKLEFYDQEEKYSIELSIETYSKNKEIQSEVIIIPKTVHINGVKIDLTSGEYKISPIKFYFDEFKFYLETKGIKEIYAKLDIEVPAELEPSYVGFDMSQYVQEKLEMNFNELMQLSEENIAELIKLNVDLPVDKTGSTYSINLDQVQIIKLVMDLMFEYYTMEGGILDQLEITGEERDQMIAQLEKEITGETVKVIEDRLKGSNLNVSFDITDNNIDSKINFDLKYNDGLEQMGMFLDVASKSSKADLREIDFPKEVKLYTTDDLMNDEYYPSEEEWNIIVLDKKDLKDINGVSYVPAKLAFSQMGIELGYDEKTKQVFAEVAGGQMPIEVNIINGVSYIELERFEQTYGISLEIR